jgi:hypothetical protein
MLAKRLSAAAAPWACCTLRRAAPACRPSAEVREAQLLFCHEVIVESCAYVTEEALHPASGTPSQNPGLPT